MAEIKAFPGTTLPDAVAGLQPVTGIIDELELLLSEARAGTLRAIAVATVRAGDVAGTLWQRPENGDHGHVLAAAVNYLAHRYTASMADDGVPRAESPAG